MDWMDWLILEAIFGASCELSLNHVYTYVYGTSPCYARSNGRIYNAVNRLIAAGYIQQTFNAKGKKRWTILPAGRRLMHQLNKKALEIIQDWQDANEAKDGANTVYGGVLRQTRKQKPVVAPAQSPSPHPATI